MDNLKEKVNDLNQLILNGKAMEAFEQYYHQDVVMQENDLPPVAGKDTNRQREIDFFGSITEFRGASLQDVVIGDNGVVASVWHYDYDHREWGERNYTQVSIQHWKEGQIVKERFFYGS